MKFITLVLGLLLVASCTHVSTTSTPVNIDGMWQGEYDSGMNNRPPVLFFFNFTRDGNSLTGVASQGIPGSGPWIPLEDGRIKGSNISFTFSPTTVEGMREIIYKFKGEIKGDEGELTFKVVMGVSRSNNLIGKGRGMGEIDGHYNIDAIKAAALGDMNIGAQDPNMNAGGSSSVKFIIKRIK